MLLPVNDMQMPAVLSETASGDTLTVDFRLDENLPVFRGHFPGQPVLPGVVQLHWAATLAAARFGISEVPVEIVRLKFKSIAVPPVSIRLSLRRYGDREVQFSFAGNDKLFSEGRLRYAVNFA